MHMKGGVSPHTHQPYLEALLCVAHPRAHRNQKHAAPAYRSDTYSLITLLQRVLNTCWSPPSRHFTFTPPP